MADVIVKVPRHWLDRYPIPRTFSGLPVDAQGFLLEDDEMRADAIVVVGWLVPSETDPDNEVILGTVTRTRVGDQITDRASHGHSYLRKLPGRRLADVFDPGTVQVVVEPTHG